MKASITNSLSGTLLKSLLIFAGLLITGYTYAQDIVWANKVLKFSSETGTKAYSASQILGKPNATPDSAGNAWRPNSQGKPETIEVGFSPAYNAKQLFIVESLTPGFIRSVVIRNVEGIEFPVASYGAKSAIKGPRLLTINLADYSVDVASVIITLIPVRNVSVSIDAVGLTNSTVPFKLTNYINVLPEVKNVPAAPVDTAKKTEPVTK